MRCLVTGGAGFIGSHLAEELLNAGHSVRIVDNMSSGKESNLAVLGGRAEILRADIRDAAAMKAAAQGMEAVFHLAAMTSVTQSVQDPALCNETNATGTVNILVAARDAGVRRVVFSSTSAVYGENPVSPKSEALGPDPLSPYAASKLAGEHFCKIFSRLYGLEAICLRYFNVFGPRQDPNSQYAAVIPKFADALSNGRQPKVFGDGGQTRDFIFVKDVVRANMAAAAGNIAPGAVFNVGTGRSVTLLELLAEFGRILGRDPKPVHGDPVPGDIRHSLADVSSIRKLLGFEAQVSLEAGLRETVAWFLGPKA